MKKVNLDNGFDVSYINGVLEIEVDGKPIYSSSDCFDKNGVWKDASKFDKKIRKSVKELMGNRPSEPIIKETKKEPPNVYEKFEYTQEVVTKPTSKPKEPTDKLKIEKESEKIEGFFARPIRFPKDLKKILK